MRGAPARRSFFGDDTGLVVMKTHIQAVHLGQPQLRGSNNTLTSLRRTSPCKFRSHEASSKFGLRVAPKP